MAVVQSVAKWMNRLPISSNFFFFLLSSRPGVVILDDSFECHVDANGKEKR
jgi:hypothetical protein